MAPTTQTARGTSLGAVDLEMLVSARLTRAQEIIAQGRVSQSRRLPTTYHVSALDNRHAYTVQLEGPSPCDCPDAVYRRRHCKHYFAAALMHLLRLAVREDRAAGERSTGLTRSLSQPGHPIWYETAPEPASVHCADCHSNISDRNPCLSCRRKFCDKCFDAASGVCLACPVDGGAL